MPETAALLDRYPVVQPFGWMTYLPQAEGEDYAEARLPTLPLGQGVGGVYHAAGLAVSAFPDMCFRDSFLLGHPGFAWAARREVMAKVGRRLRSAIARTRTRTRARARILSLPLALILSLPRTRTRTRTLNLTLTLTLTRP